MKIMRKARDTWSNSFTYTLIESRYSNNMALVNKVDKKAKVSIDEAIKFQILTHCFIIQKVYQI